MIQGWIFLVVGLVALAVAITVGDLIFSWLRRPRMVALVASSRSALDARSAVEAGSTTRRDAIRNRLAAIQAAGEDASGVRGQGSGVGR